MDSPRPSERPSDPTTRPPPDPTSPSRITPAAPAAPAARGDDVWAAEAALAFAVAGATGGGDTAAVALRGAVGGYARALKAQGALVERAVIALERVVQAAGVPRFGTAEDAALTAQAVAWCLEAYHAARGDGGRARRGRAPGQTGSRTP
jgi:hypothetical protein